MTMTNQSRTELEDNVPAAEQPRRQANAKGFRDVAGNRSMIFRNRVVAGDMLVKRLEGRELRDPLVLAIPRGGLVVGAVLGIELNAELDVFLTRKLRAPEHPELAVGAVAEYGSVYLHQHGHEVFDVTDLYLAEEKRHQLGEIAYRKQIYRACAAAGGGPGPVGHRRR